MKRPERRAALRWSGRQAAWRRLAGQAAVEATVLLAILVLVLLAGEPSLLEDLLAAVQQRYARFTYAIAMP